MLPPGLGLTQTCGHAQSPLPVQGWKAKTTVPEVHCEPLVVPEEPLELDPEERDVAFDVALERVLLALEPEDDEEVVLVPGEVPVVAPLQPVAPQAAARTTIASKVAGRVVLMFSRVVGPSTTTFNRSRA